MRTLNLKQQSMIEKVININTKKKIVMLNVSGNKTISDLEVNGNVYCINDKFEVLWQIKPVITGFSRDPFVNIELNDKRELIAKNFSGFQYRVNLETGDVEEIGWNK